MYYYGATKLVTEFTETEKNNCVVKDFTYNIVLCEQYVEYERAYISIHVINCQMYVFI
jgi:hypothetical protein